MHSGSIPPLVCFYFIFFFYLHQNFAQKPKKYVKKARTLRNGTRIEQKIAQKTSKMKEKELEERWEENKKVVVKTVNKMVEINISFGSNNKSLILFGSVFKTEMDEISTIPGKLFYLTYLMCKENQIDVRGKHILKDLIISNSPAIEHAYETYLKDGTQLTLRTSLFSIQKSQLEKEDGRSQQSKKSRNLKRIIIPPKNIQKVPQFLRSM